MKQFKIYVKYLLLAVSGVFLAACSNGKCNNTAETIHDIHTFPNGSQLYGVTNFTIQAGESLTGNYRLKGGTVPFQLGLSTTLNSQSLTNSLILATPPCSESAICGIFTPVTLAISQGNPESTSILNVQVGQNLPVGSNILTLWATYSYLSNQVIFESIGTILVNVTAAPTPPVTISSVLSATSDAKTPIKGVAVGMSFYIVLNLSGGSSSYTTSVTPILPSGMSFISASSCTLTNPSNTKCSLRVSVTSTNVGNVNITYTPSGSVSPSTLNVLNFWSRISGGAGQPDGFGYAGPYGITNSSMVTLTDAEGNIWGYESGFWNQLTGMGGQPDINYPSTSQINNGVATPNSLLAATTNLWQYDNDMWSQLTKATIFAISVNSNPNSIFVIIQDDSLLWSKINAGAWQQLSGNIGQPNMICQLIGKTAVNLLLIRDGSCGGDNQFWSYINGTWTKLTTGSSPTLSQPGGNTNMAVWSSELTSSYNGAPLVLNYATPESIIVSSSTPPSTDLWIYTNSAWSKLTNPVVNSAPHYINKVWGNQTVTAMLVTDANNNLWAYKNASWTELTTGRSSVSRPANIIYASINSTPDDAWVVSNNHQIWHYINSIWTNVTSTTSMPNNVTQILGSPDPNNLVVIDTNNQVWIFNGVWTQITGLNASQPSSAGLLGYGFNAASYALISPFQILLIDNSTNIWVGKGYSF